MRLICRSVRVLVQMSLVGLLLGGMVHASEGRTGTLRDVRHVVIFMQENRSFDHYFGSLAGVRGFGDRAPVVFTNGNSTFYQPFSRSYVLPFHITTQCVEDLDHSWDGGHGVWRLGKWDSWVGIKSTTTMSYYTRAELPYYYALADAYTICDAAFCSVMGPTNPNRLYLWTGMVDPKGKSGGPVTDNFEPSSGFTWTTYPERLQSAGISWRVYQEVDNYDDNALAWFAAYKKAKPGSPLYDRGMAFVQDLVKAFRTDVTNNTLPAVSWLIARTADSEHPYDSPSSGAFITSQLLQALAMNPDVYNSTVFILCYDENDGFFDHVPSPTPAAGTPDEFVAGSPIGLGVRVPMILVSPWSRGGYVCSEVFDHTSILRFLERWTGVVEPNISAWRRQVCGDLTSAFDFSTMDTNPPALPSISRVVCTGSVSPRVPSPQVFPVQEPGTRSARPLPYQPDAWLVPLCGLGRIQVVMTNSGTASAHFAIYPNAFRNDGPWPYDVPPGVSSNGTFVITGNAGRFDFSCYGPNGFLRRFAGSVSNACGQVDARSSIDPDAGTISLRLSNSSQDPVHFTVTATAYQAGGPWVYEVAPGATVLHVDDAVANGDGAYEFDVTVDADAQFLRRFAGKLERSPLRLAATLADAGLQVCFPAWARDYTLESTADLASGVWTAVAGASVESAGCRRLPVEAAAIRQFLRLRR
jgi:phospholipase C